MEDKGYLYILKSEKDGRFYIGQTSDLIERMAAHTRGSVKSTKNRRPLELVFFKSFNSKSEAMREENRLKCYKKTKDFLFSMATQMFLYSNGIEKIDGPIV